MRGRAVLAVLGFALVGMTSSALAAPGDFHTSYLGSDGFAAVSYGTETSYTDSAYRCGVLLAGTTVVSGVRRPILTRLNSSTGAVDTTFGTSGHKVDTTIPTSVQPYSAVIVQTFTGGWPNFTETSYIYQVVSTPTDIYVYKFACANGAQQWRQQVNFAGGGVNTHLAVYTNDVFINGSTPVHVVIAATAKDTSTSPVDGVFIKMSDSGVLDSTFGTNGRAWVHANTTNRFSAIAATAWGYCGIGRVRASSSVPYDVLVACVNSGTGALNTAFSGDGIEVFNFGDAAFPVASGRAVAWDSTTLTVVANVCESTTPNCKLGAARLTSTGAFDTTFDGDGKALLTLGSFGISVGAARLLKINTRTYVSGQYYTAAGAASADSFLFAMTNSGAGDTTFGSNGLRTYSNAATGLEGYGGMSVNGNSAIIIAGDRDVSGVPRGVGSIHVP